MITYLSNGTVSWIIKHSNSKLIGGLQNISDAIATNTIPDPIKQRDKLVFSGLAGYGIFWYIWSKNVQKGKVPSYYTHLLLIALGIALGLALFIISNLVVQIYHISRKLTVKSDFAIRVKYRDNELNNRSNEALKEYIKDLSFKEKICNIFKFLFAKIDKSLIIPERDLIDNSS